MSFETLKKDELLEVAEEFGVEVEASETKAVIIAALAEDGVTWEDAAKFNKSVAEKDVEVKEEKKAEEVAAKEAEEKHLLKMLRANGTYEIRGITFKKEHPFALVAASDAEWIVENIEGFRYATPKEAQEFYG